VAVLASEAAQIAAELTSTVTASGGSLSGGGTVQAINAQIATNAVQAKAHASITDSVLELAGAVAVEANNKAGIDATVLIATSSGDLAVSLALAFNTVGWSTQNLLFNIVDTVLGDPLIAEALGANTQS
jgi:hypothetical protein